MAKKDNDQLKLAKESLDREHSRWKANMIYYFIILGVIAIGYNFLKEIINPFYIFLGLTFVSCICLSRVLNLRRSTESWINTIYKLKRNKKHAISTFRKEFKKFSVRDDFKANFLHRRKHFFSSVSKLFILLNLVLIICFGTLTIISALNFSEIDPHNNSRKINRSMNNKPDTTANRTIILYDRFYK